MEFFCLQGCELQWNNTEWQELTDPAMLPHDQYAGDFPTVNTSFPDDGVADFHASASFAGQSDGAPGYNIVGESLCPVAVTPKCSLEVLCPDRGSVISRYREKRKTRRLVFLQ